MVEALLGGGADPDIQLGITGCTALMDATRIGDTAIMEVLLEAGANPDIQDKHLRYTALMRAAQQGHTEAVQVLIDAGADVDVENFFHKTAITITQEKGDKEMVALLKKCQKSQSRKIITPDY